jgi:hypothetical protein
VVKFRGRILQSRAKAKAARTTAERRKLPVNASAELLLGQQSAPVATPAFEPPREAIRKLLTILVEQSLRSPDLDSHQRMSTGLNEAATGKWSL